MSREKLPYTKACELEDFADPELAEVLREVHAPEAESSAAWPAGAEHRKHWEVAMSVRALRDFGALRPDAEILGVGAGSEITCFYLTRHARRVVVTDLYLTPGEEWKTVAPPLMLAAPERLSPIAFERERLEVLHMDGRRLRFPDDSFDGIFSSGSIEHFGSWEDIAAAAREMGRVLKPGGVLSLSTELLLEGPPGSIGWPGTALLSPERLRREIIEASGLEPVDPPDLGVSPRTLATTRGLLEVVQAVEDGHPIFPHLVLTRDGQLFTSVHLTLRKTERYPVRDHAPDPLEETFHRWSAVHARSRLEEAAQGNAFVRALGFLRRTVRRVRDLGVSQDLQRDLFRALIDRQAEPADGDLKSTVAGLKASESDILGVLDVMWKRHAEHRTATGRGEEGSGEMAGLVDRHEALRARQARLEGDLADLREEIAVLRSPRV